MKSWRKLLLFGVETVENRVDRFKLYLKLRYGLLGRVNILPYRGHGTSRELNISGRVMEEKEIRLPERDDPALRNLRAMIRRFISAEVPGAYLRVRSGGQERMVVADREGFYRTQIEPPGTPDDDWREVELELLWPMGRRQREASAVGEVLVVPDDAAFGVISDVDDTIVLTGATSVLMTIRLVLFSNAHTRLPFEGVAAFYRALKRGGGGAPIFYVSTGPWNLYDLISDFIRLQKIPTGPIFLKDWGGLKDILRGMNHREHKLEVIRGILDTYPNLPFVFVGDSGQEDAETYAQISREYPGRIRAIYIRDVDRPYGERDRVVRGIVEDVRATGVPMMLVQDTGAAAEHAAGIGLISPDDLPEIRQEREEDAADDK